MPPPALLTHRPLPDARTSWPPAPSLARTLLLEDEDFSEPRAPGSPGLGGRGILALRFDPLSVPGPAATRGGCGGGATTAGLRPPRWPGRGP